MGLATVRRVLRDSREIIMDLGDVYPKPGHVQRLYCDHCNGYLDLIFDTFSECVSTIDVTINNLPFLFCPACDARYLPDDSRFAIIRLHEMAAERGQKTVHCNRNKSNGTYDRGNVKFVYDWDDYRYIPGLQRPHDSGFLTPVFFDKEILAIFDTLPKYNVSFASTTYGTIYADDITISFGINRNGHVIMWLGDIYTLPESEKYLLKSKNIPSDHSIGSEFYDGQIECIFTEHSREETLFMARTNFLDAFLKRFGLKAARFEIEIVELAGELKGVLLDTPKERRSVTDILNKIYLESFDSENLGNVIVNSGEKLQGSERSIKRLEKIFAVIGRDHDIKTLMMPFYVLYDLRVAWSHLLPNASMTEKMLSITDRLGLERECGYIPVYQSIVAKLSESFEEMTDRLKPPPAGDDEGTATRSTAGT